ncbi:hypothetical protein [Nostoc sp. ChiQUE01b]|uniref:hypothetical protein n=1 Tax=Nostoc sp. ChiQUE01b TaxID=3075376 RepID=UPI002AD3F76E|nr:hypothetical protein [Nostoc sp. ChiQUE01b]MDZ8262024.1 hypothetical protein [Nostoc sp. ChiQUE01b]
MISSLILNKNVVLSRIIRVAETELTFYLSFALPHTYEIPAGREVATIRTETEEAIALVRLGNPPPPAPLQKLMLSCTCLKNFPSPTNRAVIQQGGALAVQVLVQNRGDRYKRFIDLEW